MMNLAWVSSLLVMPGGTLKFSLQAKNLPAKMAWEDFCKDLFISKQQQKIKNLFDLIYRWNETLEIE